MSKAKVIWEEGRDGRPEAWSGEDCPVYVVWCPSHPSGPRKIATIPPRGFLGTRRAMEDCLGPYLDEAVACEAALRDEARQTA